ncbi:hypothetical protein MRX96_019069 [Rhipicephalus microplus]
MRANAHVQRARARTRRTFDAAAGSAGWKLFVEMFSLMVTNVNGILFCPPGATKTKRKFSEAIIIQRVAVCSQLLARMHLASL